MKYFYNLYYGNKLLFIHENYNACIGQAKFYFRKKKMNKEQFYIINTENGIKNYINEEQLRGEK